MDNPQNKISFTNVLLPDPDSPVTAVITPKGNLTFIFFKGSLFALDIRPIVISFVCAIQFDGFRKVNNLVFASVFCTGNLRSMSEHLYKYIFLKKSESRYPFLIYLTVVLVFLFGVIFGAAMSKYYFHNAILAPIAIMIVNLFFVIGIQNKFGKKRI